MVWAGLSREAAIALCAAVLCAFVVPFFYLGQGRTLTSHEAYLVVTTREMVDSGDWIVPRFGGLPRLTKPPLGYWSASLTALALGGTTEFTCRLPAAISSVALVALLGWWAMRWYGRAAGICAMLIQTTTVYHTLYSREATVDMLQCLLMTVCMFLVIEQPDPLTSADRWRARGRWLAIYGLLGVLALAKFHFGPVLVVAPILVYWIVDRQPARFLNLFNPVGVLLFCAFALSWPELILQRVDYAYAIWRHETLGRAMGEMNREPAWHFLQIIPSLAFPGILLLPWMLRDSWLRSSQPIAPQETGNGRSHERFLWTWIIVQTVLLSLSANKHKNYIIPALPALVLLLSPTLAAILQDLKTRQYQLPRWIPVVVVPGLLIGLSIVSLKVTRHWPMLQAPTLLLATTLLIGGCGLLWLLAQRKPALAGLTAVMLFLVSHTTMMGAMMPVRDYRLPAAEFARTLRKTHPNARICLYGMGQSPVAYYMDDPMIRCETDDDILPYLCKERDLLVLTIEPLITQLAPMGNVFVLETIPPHPATTHDTPNLVFLRYTAPASLSRTPPESIWR